MRPTRKLKFTASKNVHPCPIYTLQTYNFSNFQTCQCCYSINLTNKFQQAGAELWQAQASLALFVQNFHALANLNELYIALL